MNEVEVPSRPSRVVSCPGVASPVDSAARGTRVHVDMMGKARDAREAWKRRQRNARHERLKQSIRVLGPMDLNAAEGRAEGEVRMPGYMGGRI